jgi:hypothetical protein
MGKKHIFSAHSDMKTGFFCKFFLFLGIILFLFYVIELLAHPLGFNENDRGIVLAFAILCLGFGCILYFFSCQFSKLSDIAQDVEGDESLTDEEDKPPQP